MQNFETMQDAVTVARQVLAGEIDPNLGCGLIAEIGEKNNHARPLLAFTLLSHEQHGHEGLGITPESCVPDILEACGELVAAQV
jgi:hypothetical protein